MCVTVLFDIASLQSVFPLFDIASLQSVFPETSNKIILIEV